MSKAKDTLPRLFALLRLIPHYPHRTTSSKLQEQLREVGYDVALRSVQRDLLKLSGPFALACDEDSVPRRWYFPKGAPIDLRDIDPATALALYLAEDHLRNLLPQGVLDRLRPQFRKARYYLDSLERNGLAHWARRVRALPNGKALLPAPIDAAVWPEISSALLDHRQLRVSYLSRSKAALKTLHLHPAGLVARHSITYLIASVDGYDDLRQFALHRIREAECLDAEAKPHEELDIDHYTHGGGFNSTGPVEQVRLVADVSPQIAWLLGETPLGHPQSLVPLAGSDWYRLRTRVPDDQETLWWVFGLGENVRILEPASWIAAVRQKALRLSELYERGDTVQ